MFGGHILSLAVKAAALTLSRSSDHKLVKLIDAVHSSFIRPVKVAASVTYEVYDKKDGALFSHRSVSAVQEGKLVFTCFVSFKSAKGDNQAGKLIYNNQEKPSVPGPDHPECLPHEHLQMKFHDLKNFPFQTYFVSPSEWRRKDWDPKDPGTVCPVPMRSRLAL